MRQRERWRYAGIQFQDFTPSLIYGNLKREYSGVCRTKFLLILNFVKTAQKIDLFSEVHLEKILSFFQRFFQFLFKNFFLFKNNIILTFWFFYILKEIVGVIEHFRRLKSNSGIHYTTSISLFEKKATLDEQKVEYQNLDKYYDQFVTWAEEFNNSSISRQRMIVNALIDRIYVFKGYQVIVVIKSTYNQFLADQADTVKEVS